MPLRETFRISAIKSNDRPAHRRKDGQVRGETCSYATLNDDIVRRIRALKRPGVGAIKIQRQLREEGIEAGYYAISGVLDGKTWRHVR